MSTMQSKCLKSSLLLLFVFILMLPLGTESCIESEREALLEFKQGLQNVGTEFYSWELHENCCMWFGVTCHNITSRVIKLNFSVSDNPLMGELSPSLLLLNHLTHLDLSNNDFSMPIPKFIGSFHHLKYLYLRKSYFFGEIPCELGNLTSLLHLDLSDNYELYSENLNWLSHLSLLTHLDMTVVNLSRSHDWLYSVNMLSHLSALILDGCSLSSIPPSLPLTNLSSLYTLDLSFNSINSSVPVWLCNLTAVTYVNLINNNFYGLPDCLGNMASLSSFNLTRNNLGLKMLPATISNLCKLKSLFLSYNHLMRSSLEFLGNSTGCLTKSLEILDLSSNKLNGTLPTSLCTFLSLERLDLSRNSFSSPIPECLAQLQQLTFFTFSSNSLNGPFPLSICQMHSLKALYLDSNNFSGPIPLCVGQLSELVAFSISFNSFSGVVTEAHFANLSRLKLLGMTSNSLSFHVSTDWVPEFSLNIIQLGSCKQGPNFPTWLRTQNFTQLDISNSEIVGIIPDWFWKFSSQLLYLNMSKNQIRGMIPREAIFTSIWGLDLSSNNFEGPLPQLSPLLGMLDLSHNSFSGSLSPMLSKSYAMILFLSHNLLTGNIPSNICENCGDLINLSDNKFSGKLPQCWNSSSAAVIDLGNNNLTGEIPSSMGSLEYLRLLRLDNNHLTGVLPPSFQNLKNLAVLDISNNKLQGKIPSWVGECLSNLILLRMSRNMFDGVIPRELALLKLLQVLDVSYNNLSGHIPKKWGEFHAMKFGQSALLNIPLSSMKVRNDNPDIFPQKMNAHYSVLVLLIVKGRILEYSGKPLDFLTGIDASHNNLSGEVPEEICNLKSLYSLNLSGNHLIGRIPKKIGNLQKLESLDLSGNRLSGSIPSNISLLYSLSHLNLSYNNLSGDIPTGKQLQTLPEQASIYDGNPYLCGPPLLIPCSTGGLGSTGGFSEDEGRFIWIWVYMGIAPGFAVGFWGLMALLAFKRTWRIAYFRFFDNLL